MSNLIRELDERILNSEARFLIYPLNGKFYVKCDGYLVAKGLKSYTEACKAIEGIVNNC